MFVLLDAQFIAALQVLVYAGAIMVLFLFVIMLLNLGRPGPTDIKGPIGLALAAVLAGLLLLELRVLGQAPPPDAIQLPAGTVAELQVRQGMVGPSIRCSRRISSRSRSRACCCSRPSWAPSSREQALHAAPVGAGHLSRDLHAWRRGCAPAPQRHRDLHVR
jgi:hypothetical protein